MEAAPTRTRPAIRSPQADNRSARSAGAGVPALARRLDVYGPVVLALYFLATTRWGSYVVPGPPYVGDIAILALLANRTFLVAAGRSGVGVREGTVAVLGGALLTWTVIRLIFGEHGVDAARDVAPYLYAVVAFLVVPLGAGGEARVRKLITAALVFHLVWVTATVLLGRLPGAPTLSWVLGGETYVFAIRPDASTFACGLLAALGVHRALLGRSPVIHLLLAGWALTVSLAGLSARGSAIAILVQLAIVVALSPVRGRERARSNGAARARTRRADPRIAVAILVLAVPIGLYAARESGVIQGIPSGFDPEAARPFEGTSRYAGTATARLRSWDHLAGWITDDPGRTVIGVGMGPNYYRDSGGLRLLSTRQGDDVRAPHNYWLNTWARLGLIGLVLVILLWVAALSLAVAIVSRPVALRDTDLLAILVAATLPITATFGVLLESPFGAIPYFWAVGHLSVRACQIGAAPSLGSLLRHRERRHPAPR